MRNTMPMTVLLFIGFGAMAQEEALSFREKTKNLIEITSGGQFDVIVQPVIEMVPETNQKALKADIKASMDSLYEELTAVYMESYTEEYVDAILAFYVSPVGRKMIADTPGITQRSMQLGQTWGMKLQPIIMKYMK